MFFSVIGFFLPESQRLVEREWNQREDKTGREVRTMIETHTRGLERRPRNKTPAGGTQVFLETLV